MQYISGSDNKQTSHEREVTWKTDNLYVKEKYFS